MPRPRHGGAAPQAACPQGPCCVPPGALLRAWQRAHASMPWPWLRALALAASALGLPWPWPWQHARKHAMAFAACPWGLPMALAAACPGHPRGMPACTPRRIAPHRPAL